MGEAFPPTPGLASASNRVVRGIEATDGERARRANDGPYRPELAEAFREGARLIAAKLGDDDNIDVIEGCPVEESEGDEGAWVHVRLFVSDAARPLMDGEEDCAAGLHSWTDQTGKLPASTPCTRCGEIYGNAQ